MSGITVTPERKPVSSDETLAMAPSMIEALRRSLEVSTDEGICLSQVAALKLLSEIEELQARKIK